MSKTRGKTIDQIEKDETFIFGSKDAKPAEKQPDARKEPKEFVVDRDQWGLFCIKYTAGGEVPDALKGRFTGIARAQDAIDNYLAMRKQKEQ